MLNWLSEFYWSKNKETTRLVDQFLLENFSEYGGLAFHLKRRKQTSQTKIKSFFVRMGYEIGSGGENRLDDIIPLCSMVELLNVGNYIIERSIDENNKDFSKLGYKIRELVLNSEFIDGDEREIFKSIIKDTNDYLYLDNSFLVLKDPLVSKDEFMGIYEKKCCLVGGNVYSNCLKLGYLKSRNSDSTILHHLSKIGLIFGTAYQMVHDIADLLPEELKRFQEDFKYYQKQYNSIRKKKLTLPIFFAMYEWTDIDKKKLLHMIEKCNYQFITKLFLEKKIVKKSKTFIGDYLKKSNKSFYYLPKNDWVDCLKFGINAVNSNVFWKHFKKLYAEIA